MPNQPFYTDPARKSFLINQDFGGGLNTTTSHENLQDRDLTALVNMSFDERGAVSRRSGMKLETPTPVPVVEGVPNPENAQMYFRFYKTPLTYDELVAIDGKIYVNGVVKLEGLQTERMMEGVQWYQKVFIATGSGLYVYDGTDIKPTDPYKPIPLEALYVGTNAISPNPNEFLSDGEGSTVQLNGVIFSSRYGTLNEEFTMTAYHTTIGGAAIEYKFEYRYPFEEDGVYHLGQDWAQNKVFKFVGEGEGDIQFRIKARRVGQIIAEAEYLVPKYTVKPQKDPEDVEPDLAGIQTCNRILLHWERLIMYGDTTNINTIYISHLKNPAYFPVPNTLFFETTRTEAVNTIVRFRDHLVAFTDTSTQALFGKSPSDYRRVVLNTSLGCIAPRGAAVLDNYIAFLSAAGISYLKSVGYVDDKANISKLDDRITNIIPQDARDAVLVVHKDQLHATFPSSKQRFRFYKSLGIWTSDESPHLDNAEDVIYNNKLYHLKKNGTITVEDSDVYNDLGHVYNAVLETRYIDFGLPYHPKKLKELQILAKSFEEGQIANLKVFIDGFNRTTDVIEWNAVLVPASEYNTFVDKLRVSGKCLRMKIRLEHSLDAYLQLLGFGIIHKLKKP